MTHEPFYADGVEHRESYNITLRVDWLERDWLETTMTSSSFSSSQ